ncbi:hypothetical protein GUJ93_ZPchr0010g9175 [Zizania palustris]|uniref:Uncharacterized protein n=1 Tax=Zizania palustris TaxID=103762 RepID=A0A8J6BGR3_ZIZPA|nr:hypothetical protein GUJ93_ZPchr0010g9175 [Zizania palustris]
MQVIDVNDLDIALNDFVNRDDNMAFHSCLEKNIEKAKNRMTSGAKDFKIGEDVVLQLEQCMQDEECSQLARQKRPAPVDGGSESSRRRKTDLASFCHNPGKNKGNGVKQHKAPVAGRYGAIRRR